MATTIITHQSILLKQIQTFYRPKSAKRSVDSTRNKLSIYSLRVSISFPNFKISENIGPQLLPYIS
jgi:hypothetical protein